MVGEMREQFNSEIDKAENEVEDLNLVNDTANMSEEESFTGSSKSMVDYGRGNARAVQ